MTIESILEEFENLAPKYGKWRIDRNLAKAWLTKKLTEYRQSVIDDIKTKIKQMEKKMNGQEVDEWNKCHAPIYADEGWIRYEEGFNEAVFEFIDNLNNLKV